MYKHFKSGILRIVRLHFINLNFFDYHFSGLPLSNCFKKRAEYSIHIFRPFILPNGVDNII